MSKDSSKKETTPVLEHKTKSQSVPWNPWIGAVFAVFIFIFSQIVAGTLISMVPIILGWSEARSTNWLNDSASVKVMYFVTTGAIIFFATKQFLKMEGARFIDIGLRRPKWTDLLYSVLALPVYMVLFLLVAVASKVIFPELDLNQKQDLGFNGVYSSLELFLIAIALIVIAPILEEIVFRGLLFGSLKKAMPVILAAVITSILFAIGHLTQGEGGTLLYIAGIDTFILSMILIYIRQKSGGLWAPIGLHALKNSIAFISVFVLATL